MKFPVSARVRAACGYESKDAAELGVVLRGNDPKCARARRAGSTGPECSDRDTAVVAVCGKSCKPFSRRGVQ